MAYYAFPLIAKGEVKGVIEIFGRKPFVIDREWEEFLATLTGQAAVAIDSSRMFDGLQRSNADLTVAYDATIEGWSRALDLRDKETEGHTQRVAQLTEQLAREMGFTELQLLHLHRGALLHDIGKMGVPDTILLKPGPLTDEEWVVMRQHPVYAYEMLSPISYLAPAIDIPYCHHEKWDGSGYPRGLAGEDIPLAARIFAVIDVWDALRSDRPYRPAWPQARALAHIKEGAGSHFGGYRHPLRAPREVGWQRLPARPRGRGHSARGPRIRGDRRVGCIALGSPLPPRVAAGRALAHIKEGAGSHFDPMVKRCS